MSKTGANTSTTLIVAPVYHSPIIGVNVKFASSPCQRSLQHVILHQMTGTRHSPVSESALIRMGRQWLARGVLAVIMLLKPFAGRLAWSYPRRWKAWQSFRYRLVQGAIPRAARTGHSSPARTLPFGVNVVGYVQSEKGTGEGMRASLRALRAAAIPHLVNQLIDPGSRNVHPAAWGPNHPYRINLVHVNPDQVPHAAHQLGWNYFSGRYNIGYWPWELPDFPDAWRASAACFHEIWVPSRFVQDAVSKIVDVPVVRIPHAIAIESCRDHEPNALERPPDGTVRFLCLFDFMSYWQRKNPFGVLEAFKRAFPNQDGVELIIKTMHADVVPAIVRELRQAARGAATRIIDEIWPREDVSRMITEADCVVSLHRSEGFGLVLAEAMALGKPVIATGYSGNTDFMTPDNSLLVNYRLVELREDIGPYMRGSRWAEPDLDHAASHMRWVVSHREQARTLGERAGQTIRDGFSPAVVGGMITERLQCASIQLRISTSPSAHVADVGLHLGNG